MQIDDYMERYKNGGYIKEMRKHVGHAPIMTCACGVIIENEKGEILLQQRRDNGCWAIIGGSMEMGETFEEAVRRETLEESGLTLGRLEIFKLLSGRDRIIEYPNGDVCFGPGIVFITREYEGPIVNDPEEVMEHRFFRKNELPDNLNKFDEDIILDWAKGSMPADGRERIPSGGRRNVPEPIFVINVSIDACTEVKTDGEWVNFLRFHGTADSAYFHGEILPGGVDCQRRSGQSPMTLSARYVMKGTDSAGRECTVFIENNGTDSPEGMRTKPLVVTDSEILTGMTRGSLYGEICEAGENAVRISIYRE